MSRTPPRPVTPPSRSWKGAPTNICRPLAAALLLAAAITASQAQTSGSRLELRREDRTLVVEPYGPNIVRVTLSKEAKAAEASPGYGFIGTPNPAGWTHAQASDGSESYKSGVLTVSISPEHPDPASRPVPMPLDKQNQALRDVYFGGPHGKTQADDTITLSTGTGSELLIMKRWSMVPNQARGDGHGGNESTEASRVGAVFSSHADEHYYGLGQYQQGFLDLRDHHLECWQNYNAIGGQTNCVPFMVSTRGYGIVWDNPSKTTVDVGFNAQTVWSSAIGDRVSFFLIAGKTADEIYQGYRKLTGTAHLLPRATYGFIQSKAIYATQQQIMEVANGYRQRKLPEDVLVVDFLNMTKQGNLDLDPARWPDPASMNDKLHSMGFTTLLSVWPHFSPGTHFYDMLKSKGWLIRKGDGTPDFGGFKEVIGPNIDTTNPEAAKWWWESIRDRYLKPDHFDFLWLDETEPDIDPEHDSFFVGSGARFYNVYPLFHTASVYEGYRRDFGDSRRCMILARSAYLGAQRNGSVFWSSDIVSTWDMLKRSVPAGLGFTASGMPYWDTDIAGFFSPALPPTYHAPHKPLLDASDVKPMIGNYEDYPELFVRWFEWGAFQPVMRAHGEREHNEVWAYGKEAEPILEKYLRLRYRMLPYTYSLAYRTYQTGAPYMRALFMDFPRDPKVHDLTDEYMYGPALLVAPVTEQGSTHREVYLPAGTDWYNYWTHERLKGGQTLLVDAPIDTLPLFVRAGSILPLAAPARNAADKQTIDAVEVYAGADTDFTLYSDDGVSYDYEHDKGTAITRLHWDEASHKLTHDGSPAWTGADSAVVKVIGR